MSRSMRGGRSGETVGKPLPRDHRITPTWCDLMLAAPPRDWSVFKQIFAEHWHAFQHAPPRSQTLDSDGLVAKMLAGGHPETMGDIASRCQPWGLGKPRVSMSCQSSLCWRCAKV